MAASHHHQQSHHMNNIHRSSPATTNTACGMTAEEEEDDLAALRIAALKTLEERKQKREPRALIVQRNNVLVIEPQDNVNDFRHSPPARRFSRERSLSPVAHRRPRSREASPNLRKISPPPSRWSPRSNCHRRSPSPYHINGGHHSPSHHSWNPGKRRLSPRTHSPRRLSHSPRRRSPVRRRSPPPCRRSPHRAALSPSRRSPRKSPQRSPLRRCSPQRSPPTRRSPRKSPLRSPQRRFSPRRRPRDSSDSRQSKSTRRNGEKRKASPPVPPSSSSSPPLSSRKRSVPSPRRKEPATLAAETEPAVSQSSSKKGRFERFEDSAASDDESCNESLLDELFRETEESTAKAEALGAESIDENSQEATEVPVSEDTRAVYDEDCLLLQADDDMDDLLVDCNAPEPVVVGEKQAPEDSVSKVNKRGEKAHEKLSDERNRTRGRQKDYSSDSLADPASRSRHSRSDRGARVEREENRERKSKVSKDDNRASLVAEKRKRSRSREKEKSKRKSSRKVSPKPEKRTASSKPEIRSQSSTQSRSRAQTSPETNIPPEDRERLEARKKKFLQKELKPSQKVISLKKSPSYKTEDSDDVRRVQDRLGEPVKESKRLSPRNEDSADAPSKSTILSRLGPPPASRGNIKDRIGHINTNSLSPIRTPQTATDTAHVKFEDFFSEERFQTM